MTDHHDAHRELLANGADAGILRDMIGLLAAWQPSYSGATSAPLICRAKSMDSLRCPSIAASRLLISLGLPHGRQCEKICSGGDRCAP